MNEKTIIRVQHNAENPYFLFARVTPQNKDLSYEAVGMMAYLLSKPTDWKVMISDLKRKGCGRDQVKRILGELVTAGYIQKQQQRTELPTGKTVYAETEYIVYETPQPTDSQLTGFQLTENPPLHNIEKTEERTSKPAASELPQKRSKQLKAVEPLSTAIVELFEQNICGMMDTAKENQLRKATQQFGESWVMDAIRLVTQRKDLKNKWAYTLGILKSWEVDGRDDVTPPQNEQRNQAAKQQRMDTASANRALMGDALNG